MVDAFLEVYHVRTVHPDNAALLYNDQSVTVSMLPNGHSRLTVEKHDMFRDFAMVSDEHDNPAVPLLWRQTSTSFGIFPNLVVPDGHRRVHVPVHVAHQRHHHRPGAAVVRAGVGRATRCPRSTWTA